jgi:hypothetical protein
MAKLQPRQTCLKVVQMLSASVAIAINIAFVASIALATFITMQHFKIGFIPVIGICDVLGLVNQLAAL